MNAERKALCKQLNELQAQQRQHNAAHSRLGNERTLLHDSRESFALAQDRGPTGPIHRRLEAGQQNAISNEWLAKMEMATFEAQQINPLISEAHRRIEEFDKKAAATTATK